MLWYFKSVIVLGTTHSEVAVSVFSFWGFGLSFWASGSLLRSFLHFAFALGDCLLRVMCLCLWFTWFCLGLEFNVEFLLLGYLLWWFVTRVLLFICYGKIRFLFTVYGVW